MKGVVGKIKSALALTWLIFLRSVDTLINFLDAISKEYRYVAKELKKLTTEGKRKRAMKVSLTFLFLSVLLFHYQRLSSYRTNSELLLMTVVICTIYIFVQYAIHSKQGGGSLKFEP